MSSARATGSPWAYVAAETDRFLAMIDDALVPAIDDPRGGSGRGHGGVPPGGQDQRPAPGHRQPAGQRGAAGPGHHRRQPGAGGRLLPYGDLLPRPLAGHRSGCSRPAGRAPGPPGPQPCHPPHRRRPGPAPEPSAPCSGPTWWTSPGSRPRADPPPLQGQAQAGRSVLVAAEDDAQARRGSARARGARWPRTRAR